MAKIIAKVENVEGKFFSKDADGNVEELSSGDIITQGMTVFGDKSNNSDASISMSREDGKGNIVLIADQEQLFDASLAEDSNVEEALAQDSVMGLFTDGENTEEENADAENTNADDVDEQETESGEEKKLKDEDSAIFAARDGNIVDVNSGLRDAKFQFTNHNYEEEKDETTAGEEKKNKDESSSDFAARDGNAVDVNSDLRDAKFQFTSHDFITENKFESESLTRLASTPSTPNTQTFSLITPSIIPSATVIQTLTPTFSTTQTTIPPVIAAVATPEISINDMSIEEVNGFMIVTVTSSSPAGSKITFNFSTQDGSAQSGTDFTAVNGTGVIQAGENSTTIKIPITNDFYIENTESFSVVLSDVSSNAIIRDNTGVGTILNNGTTDGVPLSEDTLFVKLIDDASVNEGSDLVHSVKLVDSNGSDVLLFDGQSVTVTLAYTPNGADATDYTAQTTVTITGTANGNGSAIITNPTLDDIFAENVEGYTLSIGTITDNAQTFENILDEGSTVKGTITDDTSIASIRETTKIILVALDEHNNPILDNNGNYTFASNANEGSIVSYKALAFSETETTFNSSTQLDSQLGSVVVSSVDTGSATTGSDFTQQTQTIALDTPFSIDVLDDSISDNGETFNVVIDSYVEPITGASYENVTTDGAIVTTIIDNTPNDEPLANKEVSIKIVSTDAAGNIIPTEAIVEGETAYYKAILVDSSGNQIVEAIGNVDITFADATAVRTGTSTDGELDFNATDATIALNTVFSAVVNDDYLADSSETFKLQLTDGSYTDAATYKNVIHNVSPVITTIIDDSQANTPNDATDTVETTVDSVTIKVVSTDASGNIIPPATIVEGTVAYYKAILVDPSGNQIIGATGDVNIVFTDGTAVRTGTAADGELDFSATSTAVTLNTVFSAVANDDYIADSSEIFHVQISNDTYTNATSYENVIYSVVPITTRIIDNSVENTPNDGTDGVEASVDKVIIKLVALDASGNPVLDGSGNYTFTNGVNEGSDAKYMALAFDPTETTFSPATKITTQAGTVDVSLSNGTATGASTQSVTDGSQDFDNDAQTITLGTVISVATFDEYMSDNSETFTIAIDANSYTRPTPTTGYEDVVIDTSLITTTITDNSSTNTPNNTTDGVEVSADSVIIKLVALDASGNPVLDGSGNYTFANSVNEGNAAKYMALAFDPTETTFSPATKITTQAGTIDVSLNNGTAIGASTQSTTDGSQDFDNDAQTTIALGTIISVATFDDYMSDSETFTVSIDANSYTPPTPTTGYEDVAIDTTAVTTTIKDGANDATANETVDTVYVQLDTNDTVKEQTNATLTHELHLVDKDGNAVNLANGETIEVTLAYSGDTTESADFSTKTTTVTITGDGGSDYSFDNTIVDDYLSEGDESYTVKIASISNAGTYFENVKIADTTNGASATVNSATGTITDAKTGNDATANETVDTVYAIIEGSSSVNEGDTTTYTVKLVDKDGNVVTVSSDTDVTVKYVNTTTQDGDTEFNNNANITVTISANGSSATFDVDSTDDFLADNNETYKLEITNVNTTEFEKVDISGFTDTNTVPHVNNITTTIKDNTGNPNILDATDVETADEQVQLRLVAADGSGNPILVGGAYVLAEDVKEGDSGNYIVLAFTPGAATTPANVVASNGTVDVSFSNGTATGASTQTLIDGSQDYDNDAQTVTIGTAFSTSTFDDYLKEGNHTFNVSIDASSYTPPTATTGYENVAIDTTAVTTTIKDGANDATANETVDTVYVQLDTNDTVKEQTNATLTHELHLVDKDGNAVNLANGETIEVTLAYSGDTTESADFSTKTTTVTITGDGGSDYSFDNTIVDDYLSEGDESYTVKIASISNAGTYFENVKIADTTNGASATVNSATGTITDAKTGNDATANETVDTIYAVISGSTTVDEGDDATYTIHLEDKDGNTVTPASDVELQVTFTNNTTEDSDYEYGNNQTHNITIVGGTSSISFTSSTLDDFVADSPENYTVTLTSIVNQNAQFENMQIGTPTGTEKSVTTALKDDISFGTPNEAYVDESDFTSGGSNSLTGKIHDDGGIADPDGNSSSGGVTKLGIITSGTFNDYTLSLDSTITPVLTAGGTAILYDYSTAGTVIGYLTGGNSTDDKVFQIVLDKHGNGGADDTYTYTQYKNLDHPDTVTTDGDSDDDTITFDFGFKITNDGTTSSTQNFTIVVNDSLPTAGTITSTLDENAVANDTGTVIWISNEDFNGGNITLGDGNGVGNGDTVYASGVSHLVDYSGKVVSDGSEIGTLKNNGNGSVTFVPKDDFSGTPTIKYTVTDSDGDSATGTLSLTVTPIADTPDMNGANAGVQSATLVTTTNEDNSNANEGTHSVSIGLLAPIITDNVDLTGAGNKDKIEMFGLITLSTNSTNNGAVVEKADGTDVFTIDGNDKTIFITDAQYHYNGLTASDADYSMTLAEFEALKVIHPEDDARNISFTVSVNSYEVDNTNTPRVGISSANNTQAYTVDIVAVTDSVDLIFNDGEAGTAAGDGTENDSDNTTYKASINEDTWFDVDNILDHTVNDADSSETYTITLSSMPVGSTLKVDGVDHTIGASGSYNFNLVNKVVPDIQFRPPENFSGDISNIGIELKAHDTDADSDESGISDTTATVHLSLNVAPIADDVTLANVSTTEDTAVKFLQNIVPIDNDGSESINSIKLNDLETGWVLKDETGAVLLTGNGATDITIDVATQGLANVKNYTLTPPGHSSSDTTLSIDVQTKDVKTVDGNVLTDTSVLMHHTQKITVTPVAELVTSDSNGVAGNDVIINPNHTYTATATEDTFYTLGTTFASENGNTFESFWSNEDDTDLTAGSHSTTTTNSEETFAHLTFYVDEAGGTTYVAQSGAVFKYNDGTNDVELTDNGSGVDIPVAYLDTLEVKSPAQISGKAKVTVEAKTVDYDEDTDASVEATSGESSLIFTIGSVAEEVTLQVDQAKGDEDAGRSNGNIATDASATTIDDASNAIDLGIKVTSSDTSETFVVTIDDIPDGGTLYYKDSAGGSTAYTFDKDSATFDRESDASKTMTITDNGDATWKVVIEDFDNSADLTFIPPHNSDVDYITGTNPFTVSAYSVDGNTDSSANPASLSMDVEVVAKADVPVNTGLTTTTDHGQTYTQVYSEGTLDSNAHKFNLADVYTIANPNSSIHSYDTTGTAEQLTIVISGLGAEFTVLGATFLGGSADTRRWSVESTDIESVKIVTPANFSGELPLTLQYITTEVEGDSKTHTIESTNDITTGNDIDNVKIWVTPTQDATINNALDQNEDTAKLLDFSINQHNDTNESLTKVYIKVATLTANTLYLGDPDSGGTLLSAEASGPNANVTLVGGYYEVTNVAMSNVYTKVDTAHSDDSYSMVVKYDVTDHTNAAPDSAIVTTSADTNYNVNIIAIADKPTVTLNANANLHTLDTDNDGAADVTPMTTQTKNVNGQNETVFQVGKNTTATFTFNLSSNDVDGSESHDYYKITHVPDGVSVVGGSSAGDGTWFLQASGSTASGISTQEIKFYFDTSNNFSTPKEIFIEGHNKDHDDSTNTADSISIFIENDPAQDGGAVAPFVAPNLTASDVVVDEDTSTPMKVNDAFSVTNNPNGYIYTIRLSGLPAGTEVTNANSFVNGAGDTIWVVSSAHFTTAEIIYPENYNKNHAGGDVNLVGVLVVPRNNVADYTDTDTSNVTITPITDTVTITPALTYYDDATVGAPDNVISEAREDGRTDIDITPTTVDSPYFNYTNAAGTTVTTVDITTDAGVSGKLIDTTTGSEFSKTGNVWSVAIDKIDNLQFVPDSDASGIVNLSYTIFTKEIGAANVQTSGVQTLTLDIKPVNDGFNITMNDINNPRDLTNNLYNEGKYIELDISISPVDVDGSEKVYAAIIENVPDKVLVYYTDAGNKVLAQNVGSTDNGVTNSWSLPLTNGNIPSEVWVRAKQNWAGTLDNIKLTVISSEADGAGTPLNDFTLNNDTADVTINPVADKIKINPTLTFGEEGESIDLKINANVRDKYDGSEYINLTLKGLGTNVLFEVSGNEMQNVSYDSATDTYTIAEIANADINNITFVTAKSATNVEITAQKFESGTAVDNGGVHDVSGVIVTGHFDVNVTPVTATAGDDTLFFSNQTTAIDGLAGYDTVVLQKDITLDFSILDNIEEINLTSRQLDLTSNGDSTLSNITLNNIIEITDADNDIVIKGDNGDTITLKSENGNVWSTASNTNDGQADIYTNSGDNTVKITVDEDINTSII